MRISLPSLRINGTGGPYGPPVPRILLSAYTVPENASIGTTIATLSVANGSGSYTFTETADPDSKFTISGTSLNTSATLNFEAAEAHSITISASNGVDAPVVGTFFIAVTNVFEQPSLNALSGTFSLAENSAQGTTAGSLTGRTTGSTLTLIDNAGGRVQLSGTTIQAGPTGLDYEAATSHSFTIRETLADSPNSPRDTTLSLTVTDVDEIAPTITSASSISINENTPLAHTLTANESVTWTIVGGVDQSHFEISGSTLRWAANGVKDFEAPADADGNNVYVVTVRATDTSGNTTDQTINANVLNVDESFLTGALTYFDTNTGSTAILQQTEGGTLSSVGDPVGYLLHAGGAWRPRSGTGSTPPVLRQTGSTRYLEIGNGSIFVSPTVSATQQIYQIAVMRVPSPQPSNGHTLASAQGPGAAIDRNIDWNGFIGGGSIMFTDTTDVTIIHPRPANFSIVEWWWDGEASFLYIDGALYRGATAGNVSATNLFTLGGDNTGFVGSDLGILDVSVYAAFGSIPSDATRAQLRAWAATASGVTQAAAVDQPQITSITPADGATVAANTNITVQFNRTITAASGSIYLYLLDGSGGFTSQEFTVFDPEVTISGSTLTLNPPDDLVAEGEYTIVISEGALQDASNRPFAGYNGRVSGYSFAIQAEEEEGSYTPPAFILGANEPYYTYWGSQDAHRDLARRGTWMNNDVQNEYPLARRNPSTGVPTAYPDEDSVNGFTYFMASDNFQLAPIRQGTYTVRYPAGMTCFGSVTGSASITEAFNSVTPGQGKITIGSGPMAVWLRFGGTLPAEGMSLTILQDGDANPHRTATDSLVDDYEYLGARIMRFMTSASINISVPNPPTATNLSANWGCRLEDMVAFCNETHSDLWLCEHHQASPDWPAAAAAYIADNLDPELKVYLEWSNETWNNIFAVFHYQRIEGIKAGYWNTAGNAAPMTSIIQATTSEIDPSTRHPLRTFNAGDIVYATLWGHGWPVLEAKQNVPIGATGILPTSGENDYWRVIVTDGQGSTAGYRYQVTRTLALWDAFEDEPALANRLVRVISGWAEVDTAANMANIITKLEWQNAYQRFDLYAYAPYWNSMQLMTFGEKALYETNLPGFLDAIYSKASAAIDIAVERSREAAIAIKARYSAAPFNRPASQMQVGSYEVNHHIDLNNTSEFPNAAAAGLALQAFRNDARLATYTEEYFTKLRDRVGGPHVLFESVQSNTTPARQGWGALYRPADRTSPNGIGINEFSGGRTIPPTLADLQPLTLTGPFIQGATITINGATAGSTITGTMPTGWTLNGAARTITLASDAPTGSQSWSLTEALAGANNTPRTSTGSNTVVAAATEANLVSYKNSLLDHNRSPVLAIDVHSSALNWMERFGPPITFREVGAYRRAELWSLEPILANNFNPFAAEDTTALFLDDWSDATVVNHVLYCPDNFDGYGRGDPSTVGVPGDQIVGGGNSYTSLLVDSIDTWTSEAPNPARIFWVYAGLRNGTNGGVLPGNPSTATPAQITNYLNLCLSTNPSEYGPWCAELVAQAQAARPGADVRLMDINGIWARAYQNTPIGDVDWDVMIEDAAPHGFASLYIILGAITYTYLFGQRPDVNYVPPVGANVDPIIVANWEEIVDFIYDEIFPTSTPPSAPTNTLAPTLSPSGTQNTGTLLTATAGTWTGSPTPTYTYQWLRNGTNISGATASTYTLQLADEGATITCRVTGTNTAGSANATTSNSATGAAPPPPEEDDLVREDDGSVTVNALAPVWPLVATRETDGTVTVTEDT